MVLVIIVALIGSHVTPEYVNFTNQERINLECLSNYYRIGNPKHRIISTKLSWTVINRKLIHTCLKANAIETAPLISPAHQMIIYIHVNFKIQRPSNSATPFPSLVCIKVYQGKHCNTNLVFKCDYFCSLGLSVQVIGKGGEREYKCSTPKQY